MKRFMMPKTLLISLFCFGGVHADINLQKGIYDAAEEMIRFDEKMNQAIAEHNRIDARDDIEMQLHDMINDFEEHEDSYILKQPINDPKNSRVEVQIRDGLLSITTTTLEKEIEHNELNISEVTTMSSSTVSLFIPNDADESSMTKSYKDGLLTITFAKRAF